MWAMLISLSYSDMLFAKRHQHNYERIELTFTNCCLLRPRKGVAVALMANWQAAEKEFCEIGCQGDARQVWDERQA